MACQILASAGAARAQPFEEVGGALGLPSQPSPLVASQLVAAVSLADLDGDGRLDLVRTGGARPPQVFRATDGGGFVEVPGALPGLASDFGANGHVLFDMDGDGDRDALILREGRDRLFENLGDGAFVDASETRLPSREGWSSSAAAGDLDGDGDLDLIVARYIDRVDFPLHRCADNLLYENVGGRFVDRGAESGLAGVRGCSFVTALVDIDDDLDLDVVVANDFAQFVGHQELWVNEGGLTFVERARELGFVAPIFAMGVALGDPDEDGRWDAVLTNIGEHAALERQDDGAFVDARAARALGLRFGPEQHQVGWTARWEDVDADGWLDLVVASGYLPAAAFIGSTDAQSSALLRGGPDGRLAPAPAGVAFIDARHGARDVQVEDLDGDGRPELVMAHINGRVGVYRNTGATGAVTTLELAPRLTAPGAAGAVVSATACGVARRRAVVGGASCGSADRGIVRLTFPACGAGQEVRGEVRWPSGYRQAFDTTTGATTRVEEPAWLTIDDVGVRLDLGAHEGAASEVALAGDGLVIGPVGVEGRVFAADVGPAAPGVAAGLDVVVDGVVWGAHPRVGPTPPAVLHDPRAPIAGAPFRVVAPPDARVRWLGDEVVVGASGEVGLTAPAEPGEHTLEVTAGGAMSSRTLTIGRAADRERSDLTVRDAHVRADTIGARTLRLRLRLLDADERPAVVAASDLGALVDGSAREVPLLEHDGQTWTMRLPHDELADGALVQPTVFGEPWFEPVRVAHVATEDDYGRLVDLSRSRCWLVEPRLWADVGDRGTVVAAFFDAHGVRLPDGPQAIVWSAVGALVVPMPAASIGALGAAATVRAGAGDGTASVVMGDQPAPLACPITVGVRPEPEAATHAALWRVGNGPSELDAPTLWVVVPRGASGRAIGPGVDVEVEVDGGEVTAPPSYVGAGRYELLIVPRETPEIEVRARVDGRIVATASAQVIDSRPPDAGPEPGPEGEHEAEHDNEHEAEQDNENEAEHDNEHEHEAEHDNEAEPEPAREPEPEPEPDVPIDTVEGRVEPDAAEADAGGEPPDPAGDGAEATVGADEGESEGAADGDDGGCRGSPTGSGALLLVLAICVWRVADRAGSPYNREVRSRETRSDEH